MHACYKIGTVIFEVEAINRELFVTLIRFMANLRQSEQMEICYVLSLLTPLRIFNCNGGVEKKRVLF